MHVGLVSLESPFDPTRGGGIAAYLRALIPVLIREGHRVTVIANATEPGVQYADNGTVRIVHFRLPGLHWYLTKLRVGGEGVALPFRQVEWSVGFYRIARSVFDEDPVDVLESPEVGTLLLHRLPCTPLVMRLHGSDYIFRKYSGEPLHSGARWNHRLEQFALRRAQAVTSPSHFMAEETTQEMGWARDRISVIPNPIAPAMLTEALEGVPAPEHDQSSPVVLYTGRVAPVKGFLPLVEATRNIRQAFPQARFMVVGPWQMPKGPEHWGLGDKETPNTDGMAWLGHLPWQTLKAWYRTATMFVMPSYYETFGISVIEAMAFGLPVVATTAGGLPEVVEDGVTGILVAPGNPRALADAIICLLRDPKLRKRMGEAGRERVLSEFTVERVVERTLSVYRAVAGH